MKLRRITTHGNWIPEIDGLRFVAIASTLLVHTMGETVTRGGLVLSPKTVSLITVLGDSGGRGVMLFFAISGFILAQPFLRQHLEHGKKVSLRDFFKRRLTRLEPPYILSLLLYATALAFYEHHAAALLLPLLSHIFYVHNFFDKLENINFVTWSLEVEVQFYIIAPLLGLLYAIRSKGLRRFLMVAIIVASAVEQRLTLGVWGYGLPGQLQFFMCGFLLADLRATRSESQIHRWWDLVSIVAWIGIFAVPQWLTSYLLVPLILVAYLATFNGPVTRQFFSTPWIALTGGMCYSFYLMHMLVIMTVFKVTRRWMVPSSLALSYLVQLALFVPCICIVSIAYYILIERPCMDPNWPHKLWLYLRRRGRTRQTVAHDG